MVTGLLIIYTIFMYTITACAMVLGAKDLWKRARAKRGSNGATVAKLLLEFIFIPILFPAELCLGFYKWCKK